MTRNIFLFAGAMLSLAQPAWAGVLGTLTVPVAQTSVLPYNPEIVALKDAEILSDLEMKELRGGFIDPTGLVYNFAINVRSDVDGNQVFTRTINVAPDMGGALQANVLNQVSAEIPSGLTVSVINNGNGITITDAAGNVSTLINQMANGTPSSIIMNTGNDRSLAQTVDMSLVLKNVANVENFSRAATQAALAQRVAIHNFGF